MIDLKKTPLHFQYAVNEIGTREQAENRGPAIRRYITLAHAGHEGDAWCAIFANAMLEKAGVMGTKSAGSQSFAHSELYFKLTYPVIGAIVVFWRGFHGSGLGHVGFFNGEHGAYVSVVGGNESDMVREEMFPKVSNHFGLIGYYWPRALPLKELTAPSIIPPLVSNANAASFKISDAGTGKVT